MVEELSIVIFILFLKNRIVHCEIVNITLRFHNYNRNNKSILKE